jgi:glycosyltransferase involved in cell wall biosynthesis
MPVECPIQAGNQRIAHLTSVHARHDMRIFKRECCTLAGAGHNICLIAPGPSRSPECNGVKMLSVRMSRTRWQRILMTVPEVLRRAVQLKAAVYHFHDPELIPIAVVLKLLGSKVIYDVHEDTPNQVFNKDWIPHGLRRVASLAVHGAERLAAHCFDRIIAATPAIAARFPAHKTAVVNNYPIVGELDTVDGQPFAARPPHVAYVGGISRERGFQQVLQALANLPRESPARLVIAGKPSSAETLAAAQKSAGWERVVYRGWCDRAELAGILSHVRAGIVTYLPAPNHMDAQPNKLFEYMSAGIPVVASDFPVWRKIVYGNRCGLLVDPLDPQAIAEALAELVNHPAQAEEMGQRGKNAVYTRYNWNSEGRTLCRVYEELVPSVQMHQHDRAADGEVAGSDIQTARAA